MMKIPSPEEIEAGLEENVRLGFMRKNSDGTFSLTSAGIKHVESLRKHVQMKWETQYVVYDEVYQYELQVYFVAEAKRWAFQVIKDPLTAFDECMVASDALYHDSETAQIAAEEWYKAHITG